MSGRHHQYYDPYTQHGYPEYLYPPGPVAHPPPHHSPPYASHLPPHVYEPRGQPYATPGSPSVQEIAAEDVKISVEGNKKRRKEVEVDDVREDQVQGQSDNYIDDPLYIRQQIMDNAQALMHILCPTAYGPHFAGRYSVILLQPQAPSSKHKDKDTKKPSRTHRSALDMQPRETWKAGVACDGIIVVEGPQAGTSFMALNSLLDSLAGKLAELIPRAWGVDDESDGEGEEGAEKTRVVEDKDGARFAVECSPDKEE